MGFKKCFGQFLDKEKGRGAGGQINQRHPNKEQGVFYKMCGSVKRKGLFERHRSPGA